MKKALLSILMSLILVSVPFSVFAETGSNGAGDDVKGYIEGDTWYNEFLGLQLMLEEGWEFDQTDQDAWINAVRRNEEGTVFITIYGDYIGTEHEYLTQEDFEAIKKQLINSFEKDDYECEAFIGMGKFQDMVLGQIQVHLQNTAADESKYSDVYYREIPVLQDGYFVEIVIIVISDNTQDTTKDYFSMFQLSGDRFSSVRTLNPETESSQETSYRSTSVPWEQYAKVGMAAALMGLFGVYEGRKNKKKRKNRLKNLDNLDRGVFVNRFTVDEIDLHYLIPSIYTYYKMKQWCIWKAQEMDLFPELLQELLQKILSLMQNETIEYSFVNELSPEERKQFRLSLPNQDWFFSVFLLNDYGNKKAQCPADVLSRYPYQQYQEESGEAKGVQHENGYEVMLRILDGH